MTRWTSIAQLAARQHGLVRVDQAAACGIPPTTLRLQVERGGWERVHPGVMVLPGAAATAERTIAAALLAAGEHALAARWTAAYLWGLVRSAPSTVHLVVPDGRRAPRLQGVASFRSSTLDREDAARAANLAVTSPARTLGDLAGFTDLAYLRSLAIDMRQRRLDTLDTVVRVCNRMATARGVGRLRRVAWELDEVRCDSVLELVVRGLLRRAGLAPHHEPMELVLGSQTLHVDVPFPEQRAGIECDGYGSHSSRSQLDIDNRRHNRLVLHGWRILRVGWTDAELHPQRLTRQVTELLQAARR